MNGPNTFSSPQMSDGERRRFESLENLRQAAYESFNDRRSYEWKLSLAIWTGQAIFLAGLVQPLGATENFPLQAPWGWIGASLAGLVLVLLHITWSNGASKANSVDKGAWIHFAMVMQEMVNAPFNSDLLCEIAALPTNRNWRQWSHFAQVTVTALLAGVSVLIIWVRTATV